jgi:anaerobic magnesium-protoporphyrin IX monomethyl ester cyclase
MKVLLISFQDNTDTIGLKYIHSYLIKNNIDSTILFAPKFYKEDFPAIEQYLKNNKPEMIGISLMSPEFIKAKEFSLHIKKVFPEIKIIWGGIHPTVDSHECIKYADYIIKGESEQAFLELVEGKLAKDILNLVYKEKGIKINKLRPFNENLDNLPFPEHFPKGSLILHKENIIPLNKSLFKKYTRYAGRFYSITATRGCPFSCTYCCNSAYSRLYGSNQIRKRSVENVIDEMKYAIKNFPEIVYINFQDDNFFSYDINWM